MGIENARHAKQPSSLAVESDDAIADESDREFGPSIRQCSRDELVAALPFPDKSDNKYTRGKLTMIAGSERYPGAACLASNAAQRMGAGYVELVTTCSARMIALADSPSLVVTLREDWDSSSVSALHEGKPQAVCVGPGFDSASSEDFELVARVLRDCACPVLVDGAALSFVATDEGFDLVKRRFEDGRQTVVTPHMGEAARLAAPFDLPTNDPAKLASLLSLAYGFTAVVKGPDTFVSDGEETFAVTQGTPDLAKAGTGDVLAGMIASLLAQDVPAVRASVLAATIHARAGVFAGRRFTTFGVRAEDVAAEIPVALVDFIG